MKLNSKARQIPGRTGLFLLLALPLSVLAQNTGLMALKHWSGIQGKAMTPPAVSAVKTPDGRDAVEAAAVLAGTTQGLLLTLPEPVDLSEVETITFKFKQTGYPKPGWGNLLIRYDKRNGISTKFRVGAPGEWTDAVVRLDWEQVKSIVRNAAAFPGKAATLQFSLYRHLDQPGESIAVADLKFNKRVASTVSGPLKPVGYSYRNRPSAGDASGTALTDGKLEKSGQAVYNAYSDNPDVVFDFGSSRMIQSLSVGAVAVPNINIDAMDIYTSGDGREFKLAAHIPNPVAGGNETSYAIKAKDLNLVSRYLRLVLDRNRVDQTITFGEVSFTGRDATNEDIRNARRAAYDLGPEMPPVTDKDYLIVKQGDNSFAVHRATGVICDVMRDGRKIAERLVRDTELFDGKSGIKFDGFRNRVTALRREGDGVVIDYTVPGLDQLSFRASCKFDTDGTLISTLQCTSRLAERRFLFTPLRVLLPQKFRDGGRYETWGSGHYLIHRNADELTAPLPADACAVMSFESPSANMTMLHHRIRYNGRFTHIGVGAATSSSSVPKNTVMLPNGWQLGDGIFLLDKPGKTVSVESRLTIVKGTLVEAFDAYLSIPEVAAFRGAIKRAPWIGKVRLQMKQGWFGLFKGQLERRLATYRTLVREGDIVCILIDNNFPWGDYPTCGKLTNFYGGYMQLEDFLERNRRLREICPGLKLIHYTWLSSVSPISQVYREHPEWFMDKDSQGKKISYFGSANENFYRLVGIPESADHILKTIPDFIRATKTDGWYLDGGGSPGCLDLFNFRMDGPDAWQRVTERMREKLQKENPDYGIVFNNPENPMGDFGILESQAGTLSAHWPDGASWMYKFKLWQRHDPDFTPLYIYWNPRVERALLQYTVGIGLSPVVIDTAPKFIPYFSAQSQSRTIRLVNAGVSPNCRFDSKETLEVMPLTFGDTGWIFMKSNQDKAQSRTVSFDPAALGLQPGLPVYNWCFSIRYPLPKHALRGEPEREDDYRKYRWDSDFIAIPACLGSKEMASRFEMPFQFDPHELKLWMVTQAPALVYSVDAMRNQLWLSDTLGVRVTGSMNDDAAQLQVSSARKSAEIIVMVPEGRKAVSAQVNGADTPFEPLFAAGAHFALLPVPRGESRVTVNYAPAEPAAGKVALTVKPRKGKLLIDSRRSGDLPSDARITLQIMQNDVPVWRGDLTADNLTVALPGGTTRGKYSLLALDLSGNILGRTAFELAEGKPVTPPMRSSITTRTVRSVSSLEVPVAYPRRGFEVLGEASICSEGCGEVRTDSKVPDIRITTLPVMTSDLNTLGGALELKTGRYLKLRFKGDFHKYNGYSNRSAQRMLTINYSGVNAFFGLTLDFGTARGYTRRTLAGCGFAMAKRSSDEPSHWGTRKNADRIVNISAFGAGSEPSEELWLDLVAMGAPADWDGRLWLGSFWHNATPARTWETEILESRDQLPEGVSAAVPWPLRGGDAVRQVGITPPVVQTPPVIDGSGKDAVWNNAPAVEKFSLLKHPLSSAPPTRVRFLRDSRNLYLLAELSSPDRDGFSIRPGLMLEKQDSLEFYFRSGDSATAFVHYIFGGLPQCYAQYNSRHKNEGGRGAAIRELAQVKFKTTATRDTMTIEAAIPLAELGKPAASTAFNIARNSTENGLARHYTLAPGDSYYNLNHYKLVWKQGE